MHGSPATSPDELPAPHHRGWSRQRFEGSRDDAQAPLGPSV